ncbi:MAG: S8 family serine peptidase, partial [Verrucomicrobiales bacterium]
NGTSNSFLIAQGILAAVDNGAKVINISMGGDGYSAVLESAVQYAQERGVVIIAAAGNKGINQIAQPASLPGVIAATSVDAVGDHLLFSNTGSISAYSAPGYAVNAEGTDGGIVSFTGTSASAPIGAGTIAAAMSNNVNKPLSAAQAVEQINATLNEAGPPGADATYGAGLLDLGRVMQSSTAGIVDAAVASQWVVGSSNGLTLQVTVQNRGTTPLFNVPVQVTTPAGTQSMNVGSLAPGKTQTFQVAVPNTAVPVTFQSSIGVSNGQSDVNPANNRRVDVFTPSASQ